MLGASILGGVGFTMAIFVANLAFADESLVVAAKAAILAASVVAGIAGFLFLLIEARADERRGVVYVAPAVPDANVTYEGESAIQAAETMAEYLDEESRRELEEVRCADHIHEVKVHFKPEMHEGEEAQR